ncbi:MAG: helix-turn-helix domain-containing protein [Hyphomicrobiaceae bacterium]|nr:helix-turn-helix domain-containing protein [Hyphomicrobiaceae bacterium]
MDSLIAAGARALVMGDALGALNHIALRDDPPALALRGIAMAQLGDLARARLLLRQAASAFGPRESVARARCITAEAEIALVCRDLAWPLKPLDSAYRTLLRHKDHANAAHARYLKARYLLLIGRLDEAERVLAAFDPSLLAPSSRAALELVNAGIAMRRLRIQSAREALERAGSIARKIRIVALSAEVESALDLLEVPAARLIAHGKVSLLKLADVETLLASKSLIIDACRHAIVNATHFVPLKTRPVLFALARALAEASPGSASRADLLLRAFGAAHVDESHRARLRVEIGRLRKLVAAVASIDATGSGFSLRSRRASDIVVLAPLTDEAHVQVLALLGDGESWPSSALALALGASQRTVQRALDELLAAGKVQAVGNARAKRWMAPPVPGFPTGLLLPAALSNG